MCLGSQHPDNMPVFAKPETPAFDNEDRQFIHEAMTRDPYLLENGWKLPDLPAAALKFLNKQAQVQKGEEAAFVEAAKKLEHQRDSLKGMCPAGFRAKGMRLSTQWCVREQKRDEGRIVGVMKGFVKEGGKVQDQETVTKLLTRSYSRVREFKKDVMLLQHEIQQYLAASKN